MTAAKPMRCLTHGCVDPIRVFGVDYCPREDCNERVAAPKDDPARASQLPRAVELAQEFEDSLREAEEAATTIAGTRERVVAALRRFLAFAPRRTPYDAPGSRDDRVPVAALWRAFLLPGERKLSRRAEKPRETMLIRATTSRQSWCCECCARPISPGRRHGLLWAGRFKLHICRRCARRSRHPKLRAVAA